MLDLQRKTILFFLALSFITLFGFTLRLIDYDRLPGWREVDDEIHYAWTGLSWLTTGVPRSWSYIESYLQVSTLNAWGTNWHIVSPMLEKPPLYNLLSGLTVLAAGQHQFDQVRLSTIRLFPVFLSLASIFLTGIVASLVFGKRVGLIAALLYAVVPTVVISNRLSITENLLTPLSLAGVSLYIYSQQKKPAAQLFPFIVGIVSGLAALTKQSGVTLLLILPSLYASQKQWKSASVCFCTGFGLALMYPLTYLLLDNHLFMTLLKQQRIMGIMGGLPQLLITIVGRPVITTERLFLDGSILLGYIVLFTSPWWLKVDSSLNNWKKQSVFVAFPIVYTLYLSLTISAAEPIGSGQGFWGWYVYPLFPFTLALVAVFLESLWQRTDFFSILIAVLILGSSTIRFFFLELPAKYHDNWQNMLIGLFLFASLTLIPHKKIRQSILFTLFCLYIGMNMYTSIFLYKIYSLIIQPF